jgi:hypothetical protein
MASLWGIFNDEDVDSMSLREEAKEYLQERTTLPPGKGGPETLDYWKMKEPEWPYLSAMAFDYLAIQGSATPVEQVWSSAAETDTKRRNLLSADQMEALQFLKAAYRKLHIRKMNEDEKKALVAARRKLIDDANLLHDVSFSTSDMSIDELEDLLCTYE